MKAHTQAHADLVAKAVDFTKEEFENRVRQELSIIEKLERQKYQSELDSLKSDLQSVVNNLKGKLLLANFCQLLFLKTKYPNKYILEQAEKEKKLFANQAIWEASEFLKSSLISSDNEKPIIIQNQINTIKKLGGISLITIK